MDNKDNIIKLKFEKVFHQQESFIFISLLILFICFTFASPVFCTSTNLLNVIRQVSLLGIQALGMTCVIAVGGIDISVGSTYALSATLSAVMMTRYNVPILPSCLMGLLVGIVIGTINGFLCGYLKMPAFIATLGTMNMARGIALLISKGMIISLDRDPVPDPEHLPAFFAFGGGSFLGIPSLALVFIVLSILMYLLFRKSIYGFRMKATGGSLDAAKSSGINTNFTIMSTYIIIGFLCGLSGIMNFAFMHTVQGTMGSGMELNVIAAVLIGGANPSGGSGTIIGTVIGILITGILKNGLVLLGVNAHAQTVLVGLLIIIVVAYNMHHEKTNS